MSSIWNDLYTWGTSWIVQGHKERRRIVDLNGETIVAYRVMRDGSTQTTFSRETLRKNLASHTNTERHHGRRTESR